MRPDLEARIVQPTVPAEARQVTLRRIIDDVAAALEEGEDQ